MSKRYKTMRSSWTSVCSWTRRSPPTVPCYRKRRLGVCMCCVNRQAEESRPSSFSEPFRMNPLRTCIFCLTLRLKLTPTPREKRTRSRTQASQPKSKRARLEAEIAQQSSVASTAAGYIQICDVDPSGKYVQIKNMSDQVWHNT